MLPLMGGGKGCGRRTHFSPRRVALIYTISTMVAWERMWEKKAIFRSSGGYDLHELSLLHFF